MKYKIIFFLLLTIKLNAQTPDSSFGTSGVLEYNTSQIKSNDLLRSAQLQADGKILYLTDEYLARYDMFDNLDSNFGQCGIIAINGARTMALLNSQKIIIYSSTYKQIFKYDTNGSLDITFGNNGVLQLPILNNIVINQIIETPDNKIVLGGAIHNGTKSDYLLIKLNSNGTLDNLFDLDGIAQYSIGTIQDIGSALAVQSDNKILLTGKSKTSTNNDDFATIRVTNTGTLDISFGTNGIVITDFTTTTTSNDYPTSISIDTNKVYVAGTSSGNLSVVRYNINNGSIDNTFNTNGKLVTNQSASNSLSLTRLDLNGGINLNLSQKINLALSSTKLILAIRSSSTGKYRLLSIDKSTLQITFWEYANINANYCNYLYVLNNDIFFGGSSLTGTNTFNSITRLKYDVNYQFSSLSIINNKQSTEQGTHLFTSADNSIYVKSKNPYKLKKIFSNGIEDNTFTFSGIINDWYFFKDNNNKLYTLDNNSTILYRYNSNGSIDNTFGISGALDLTNYQNGCVTFIDDIRLDNNNNIYIVFDFDHNTTNGLYNDYSFGVIKTNYQGQIDASFGTNSIVSYRFNSTSTNDWEIPAGLIINNDSIVIHGWAKSSTSNYFLKSLFFKIDLNGNLISSFGLNGKKIIDGIRVYESNLFNSAYYYKGISVSQESNKLIKFDEQGNVDLNFGSNGVLTVNQLDVCNVFKIKSCDGIYVAGSKNNQFAITKFTFEGNLDTSFGTNGIYVKAINCYSSINAIDFSQNNTLTAVGYSWNGIGDKVTLLQLIGLPNNSINIPIANATQSFNAGDTLANLTVTGSNLQWYSAASGGSPLPLNTTLVSGTTYYVSQTVNGCESSRIAITVTQNLSNESFVLNGFIIYPNPTTSILNFKSVVAVETIAIYNMLGQLVQQEKVNALEGAINIEKLAQGTYLVKVNDIAKGYTIIKN